jgi:hypothetical protein
VSLLSTVLSKLGVGSRTAAPAPSLQRTPPRIGEPGARVRTIASAGSAGQYHRSA